MRTLALLALALLVRGNDTVYKFPDVPSHVAVKLLEVECKGCATCDGKVDVWYPDGFSADSIFAGRNYTLDIRGGAELVEVAESFGLKPTVKVQSVRELIKAESLNGTEDWNSEYHTFADIDTRLRSFASTYGAQYVASIGSTFDGASIPALRFGSSPRKDIIYLQCGIHAREWISPATCMYYIEQMLIDVQKGTQPMAGLLAQTEVFVVPVLNVDGYKFTWSDNRMWRKNRRLNSDGSYGVDMNRNWDDHWGLCGSSATPRSDTYRGTGPFSESETAAVRTLFQQLKTSVFRIQSGIDFHSYGELILRPYGWTLPNVPCPDAPSQPAVCVPPNENHNKAVADGMQAAIKEVHGVAYTSEHAAELYCAAGGADDWIAISTAQASGFCFELRDTGSYGFVLPAEQIIPTGEEIYGAMKYYFAEVIKSRE